MPQVKVDDRSNPMSKLRLLWNDSRCLNAYLTGISAIAVWLKFAIMAIHWRSPGVWMH
jgi:hypothetical protein